MHMLPYAGVWSCGDPEHVFKNAMKSAFNWILRDETFFSFRIFKTLSVCSDSTFRVRLMACNSKRSIVGRDATCTSDLVRLVSVQNESILRDCGHVISTLIPEMVCHHQNVKGCVSSPKCQRVGAVHITIRKNLNLL